MNNLSGQMVDLMRGIASDALERKKSINDIRKQTASTLLAFDQERIAMSNALKSSLSSDRASRSAEVLEIRHDAGKMCMEFRDEHVRMGHSLRKSLVATKLSVVSAVTSLRTEFLKERASFNKMHRHMSRLQRKSLIKDRIDRFHAVADLMNSFTKAHRHMAKVQHTKLVKGRQARSDEVVALMRSFHADSAPVLQMTTPFINRLKPPELTQVVEPVQVQLPVPASVETSIKEPLSSFNWSLAVQDKSPVVAAVSRKKDPSLFTEQVAEVVGALKKTRAPEAAKFAVPRPAQTKAGKSKKK